MTVVLAVTSNPQTFNGGTWTAASLALNGGITRFTFAPTAASTTFTGGNFHALFGQAHGAIWLNDANLELYTTPGDALVFSHALTWSAAQTMTVTVDARGKSVTISGATTGNGTFTFTQVGPYYDATQLMEAGRFGAGNFQFAGTISSIDDTAPNQSWVPSLPANPILRIPSVALLMGGLVAPPVVPQATAPPLSWDPVVPAYQLRGAPRPLNVGGEFAPTTIVPAPIAPAMSWTPVFPDLVPRARSAINEGGATGPVAVIVQAAAPLLSWAPKFPDFAPRARGPLNTGGITGPESVIPQPPSPGMSWAPQFPDFLNRPRHPMHAAAGLSAPPFAGGKSLTVGVAAVRQNILSQLAFSTPLTTFGTDLTFTASGNTLTTGTHGMVVCAGPFNLKTTGTLPAGSDASTLYYMIVPSTTTVQLALTPALAKAGTAVALTDAGTGTHTLVRAVNTAPLYSTLVAIFARGTQASSPNQATDSLGNTYSYIPSAPRAYDAFNTSSFSIATSFRSKGGNAHTWSASIGNIGGQQDEVVIGGLEIFNAPILQSSSVVEIADGTQATITSGTVTTTAKALLVGVVGGNGNVNQGHVFTTPAGFTRIPQVCAEGDVNVAGYIQIEVFVRLVDIKGTYKYSTQGTSSEGAMLWLMAFQAQATDLQPLDWIYQQAEVPRGARRPLEGGETAPPRIIAPVAPLLSWSPVFPDAVTQVGRRQPAGETAPPSSGDAAKLLAWLPTVLDPPRARRVPIGGETAPPVVPAPPPWWPSFPDWLPRPAFRIHAGETSPARAPAPAAPPASSWMPQFPDLVTRAIVRILGGETAPVTTPPPAAVPPIGSWSPSFPHAIARQVQRQPGGEIAPVMIVVPPVAPPMASWVQQPVMVTLRARRPPPGEAVGPVLAIPQPPAPPLWSPVYPDIVLRARPRQLSGEVGPFSGAINFAPPLVQLSPIVTATAGDLLSVTAAARDILIATADNMTTPLSLVLFHGETRIITLLVTDPDTGLPADLTSGKWQVSIIEYQVKAAIEGPDPPLIAKSLAGGGITVTAPATVKIVIDPADTPPLAPGRYAHDCVATFMSGARVYLIKPRGIRVLGVVNQL